MTRIINQMQLYCIYGRFAIIKSVNITSCLFSPSGEIELVEPHSVTYIFISRTFSETIILSLTPLFVWSVCVHFDVYFASLHRIFVHAYTWKPNTGVWAFCQKYPIAWAGSSSLFENGHGWYTLACANSENICYEERMRARRTWGECVMIVFWVWMCVHVWVFRGPLDSLGKFPSGDKLRNRF